MAVATPHNALMWPYLVELKNLTIPAVRYVDGPNTAKEACFKTHMRAALARAIF